MSKPRKRIKGHANSCSGKIRYETLAAAEKAAFRPRKNGRYGVMDFMQAYKCNRPSCGGYHYGHPRVNK